MERQMDPELIRESSKPCPRCAAPSFKFSGCNHMSCMECERRFGEATQWCWLCAQDMGGLNGVTEHYQAGKCAGGQFVAAERWMDEQHGYLKYPLRVLRFSYTVIGLLIWREWARLLWSAVLVASHAVGLSVSFGTLLITCCMFCGFSALVAGPAGPVVLCVLSCGISIIAFVTLLGIPPLLLCVFGYLLFALFWEACVIVLCVLLVCPFGVVLGVIRYLSLIHISEPTRPY
eukprot:TRINITY_DN22629_c0_g1_i1.p1 TRINITY_DN22629_c0_g1~~TRINITY_DN22629_c0_g1_i1.p1  ORF type:complete len:232 (+),score=45.88 TRINITY_DN22629_c0_g1_i1:315-1010(+)